MFLIVKNIFKFNYLYRVKFKHSAKIIIYFEMKIHFIAIGGAIMHQLAIVTKKKGNHVSGSDDYIADPARTNLKKEKLLPESEGWWPEKINSDIDAVILGMHAKSDNPELIKAQELGLKIYSFPEYIFELSKNKVRIVIAGSHGKTTTTSMIMHVLKNQNIDFDYLVGAKVEGFEHSVKISDAPFIIIEGDEYLSSAINPIPKILFYQPQISVISGIAWDHVNVFPTYENYWNQFLLFLNQMKKEEVVIFNEEDNEVLRAIKAAENPNLEFIPYRTPVYQISNHQSIVEVENRQILLDIFGQHNLQNMEAARLVCEQIGISKLAFYQSISNFKGAARRLEKIIEKPNLVVFRDFAHAPSKLKATLSAVRQQFPNYFLIACFELHTFSSLSQQFLNQYQNTMDEADAAGVFYSEHALKLKNLPELNPEDIFQHFGNTELTVINQTPELKEWIIQQQKSTQLPVCLLLMSSGTFENMILDF